ncbi:hypothetical protein BV898_04239 [Hypsibius exemplaris]|uniref:Uncharacterized protein n=1 Tax=Hypsibius exemplaris TaxID=2072580 RepID=A0A1W0X2U0_HYPEX|nr:hypothetical protein BV898_04239 [Hypsibius exemplaris]
MLFAPLLTPDLTIRGHGSDLYGPWKFATDHYPVLELDQETSHVADHDQAVIMTRPNKVQTTLRRPAPPSPIALDT